VFSVSASSTAHIDLRGTDADLTQVTGYEANVNFEDADGIANGEMDVNAGELFANSSVNINPVTGVVALSGNTTPTTASANSGDFHVNLATPAASVMQQAVTVSDASISFDATKFLIAEEPFVVADVEDLKYQGTIFGPFDWVSDSQRAVNTIFRITGLSPSIRAMPLQVIVTNSRTGLNGTYRTTILGSDVEGSEYRINSAKLEEIAGAFGTADITFVFSGAGTNNLDVDRLLAGPNTATVVPFGDGANQDGGNSSNSVSPGENRNDDVGSF